MLRALFSKRTSRKDREAALHAMVETMNTLDYSGLRNVMAEDAVIIDAGGRKMEGLDEIIETDREFRIQAGRPKVVLDSLDHTREEVLVRGHMDSDLPTINGPLMWRAEFDGNLIKRVEVTRPNELMSAPLYAAQRRRRAAS